ncbi:hypothetical protein [Endozoicomonas sp. SESOKO1]|uniref:hypothetical protein n=1 Tax=Endozoicomonas sp. SESOKO1 TaxID=2828742 RepID=UPI002147CC94|nr:hypothetical protein [Endozoicomonas sp. SESOKO1]
MTLNMISNSDFLFSKKVRLGNKAKSFVDSKTFPSDTHALVGCYNTSNIGDLALRDGATKIITSLGGKVKSCNYADISSIVGKSKSLILGGGGGCLQLTQHHQ